LAPVGSDVVQTIGHEGDEDVGLDAILHLVAKLPDSRVT
jgi:hypothetical protein